MTGTRQIAGRDLNVAVGADDRLFAVGEVARQQHRVEFGHGAIGTGHFDFLCLRSIGQTILGEDFRRCQTAVRTWHLP